MNKYVHHLIHEPVASLNIPVYDAVNLLYSWFMFSSAIFIFKIIIFSFGARWNKEYRWNIDETRNYLTE